MFEQTYGFTIWPIAVAVCYNHHYNLWGICLHPTTDEITEMLFLQRLFDSTKKSKKSTNLPTSLTFVLWHWRIMLIEIQQMIFIIPKSDNISLIIEWRLTQKHVCSYISMGKYTGVITIFKICNFLFSCIPNTHLDIDWNDPGHACWLIP